MDHQQKPRDLSTFETCHQCKGGCRKHRDDSDRSDSKVIPWPQSPSSKVASSTLRNVQIALEDQTYAEHLRGLLEEDGKHRAHVVDRPITTIGGVVVLDETVLGHVGVLEATDACRYILLSNDSYDADKLWETGVRCVIPAKFPPNVVRATILGMELRPER